MQEYLQRLSTKQKTVVAIIALIIILIAFIVIYKYFNAEEKQSEILDNQTESENEIIEEESAFSLNSKKGKVIVHVIGEVNNPSVVTLNEGARIIDAIIAAGDKTEEADLSKINLAYVVEDGSQIYVPRLGEQRDEYITEEAGEGIITETASLDKNETKEIKVNINTASVEKLQTLPGVGNSTAQKIVDYRTQNGKFKTEEDLKNVPGIGENKFNNLKDKITVK